MESWRPNTSSMKAEAVNTMHVFGRALNIALCTNGTSWVNISIQTYIINLYHKPVSFVSLMLYHNISLKTEILSMVLFNR